jgi:Zn-dependent metalloprotease
MCQHTDHNPLHCILPPYVLRTIAERSSDTERSHMVETLENDAALRLLRIEKPFRLGMIRSLSFSDQPLERKIRMIYSAEGTQMLPGNLVRDEGEPPSHDPAVNEAYDALGHTYDFFWDLFERDSLDGAGCILAATVHFGQHYGNAFWNGGQMIFGDGDDQIFKRFTLALEVIGHELTHGIIQKEVKLNYLHQPGALNESIADVFGSLIKQRSLNQSAAEADWLIGADLLTDQVEGNALRSLAQPGSAYNDPILGKDPQPSHMNDFVYTSDDYGGVHINSGIPNRAFYLFAMALGGYAWERAGRVWYHTLLRSEFRSNTGFRRFARLTFEAAERLYGPASLESVALREAWQQVGIAV